MLTSNEISNQIKNNTITINNMKSHALDKPNSCKVTLGDSLYYFDYSIIDTKKNYSYINEIMTGNLDKLRKTNISSDGFLLEPHKVYLAKTNEHIKTNGYIPVLNGKVSLSLLGLSIELNNGYYSDNFDGNLLLSIVATKPTIIYPNIDIGNLTFFKSLSESSNTIGMLSGNEIKSRLGKDIIITPDDKMLINPNSVNLTLNENIAYYKNQILDLKGENEVETIIIPEDGLILYPNQIYLGRTNEWTQTENLIPMISGRSSLGRLGYHAHCSASMGSIGYEGYWHLGIRTSLPLKVYKDMRCCQIYYFTPIGEITDTYSGFMQNLEEDNFSNHIYKKMTKN